MDHVLRNLHLGLRGLVRRPAFTVIAVAVLALGIGSNTAIFSIINSMLLRPYPYPRPEALMMVQSQSGRSSGRVSFLDYRDFRESNTVFADMGAVVVDRFNIHGENEPLRIKGGRATASLFSTLGGKMTLGRPFRPEEDQPGAGRVVILTEQLWRQAFAADPDIIGKSILLSERPHEVVGVIPPESQFPDIDAAELFVPLAIDPATADRADRFLFVVARLKDGYTAEQAQAAVAVIGGRLATEHPVSNDGWSAEVVSLREFRSQEYSQTFLLLSSVVGFVLLLACANVANLLLQRAYSRQRELAVRSALGANRWHIVQQLVIESALLALLGGVAGLFLAHWTLRVLVRYIPQELPSYLGEFRLDPMSLVFMVAVSGLTAFLFGLAPMRTTLRFDLRAALSEGGDRGSSHGGHILRNTLVVVQVALSMVLLVGADLMVTSLRRLQNVDPGFDVKNVLTTELELSSFDYPEAYQRIAFFDDALQRLAKMRNVEHSAIGTNPLVSGWSQSEILLEGQGEIDRRKNPRVGYQLVAGEYFKTTGVPLREGRTLNDQDREESQRVCVISDKLANLFWPGESALGRRLRIYSLRTDSWWTVVGVVGSTRRTGLERGLGLDVYVPYRQSPYGRSQLYVRTSSSVPSLSLVDDVRRALRAIDPDLPFSEFTTVKQMVHDSIWYHRVSSLLVGGFTLIALIIATVGIYGAVSFSASQRTREIGIRMALGARSREVLTMVLTRGSILAGTGIAVGVVGALALSRFLQSLLFEVQSTNPWILVESSALLVLVTLAANYIPASRAAKVDPVTVLRYE